MTNCPGPSCPRSQSHVADDAGGPPKPPSAFEGAPFKLRLGGDFLWWTEVPNPHPNLAKSATLGWGTQFTFPLRTKR